MSLVQRLCSLLALCGWWSGFSLGYDLENERLLCKQKH